MKIIEATGGKEKWNNFVMGNYPPIGAFMQTWEWGEFKKSLGRKIKRYYVLGDSEPVASFTLVCHKLPFGFSYGYIPRGPVIGKEISDETAAEIFGLIKDWAVKNYPGFIFLRLEPPAEGVSKEILNLGFQIPAYYIQPRFNLAVPLKAAEEEILAGFHPSTRSNIGRAEKRGVTVKIKPDMSEADFGEFFEMERETIERNSGVNAYPSQSYFRSMFKSIPIAAENTDPSVLSLGIFCGYQNGEPASTEFVLFFGDTATYLYGASKSKHLPSKVVTYLHWSAMRDAKRRGMKHYDIGGIDEKLWPSLTDFKRQFRGKEFEYIGNIDYVYRPFLYRLYNLARKIKKQV